MKKLLILTSFLSFFSIAAIASTYAEGAKAGYEKVNELKTILLESGYYGWGVVVQQRLREVKPDGSLGESYNYSWELPPGVLYVFTLSYSWVQSNFDVMAWSDVSVITVYNWLFANKNVNDYYRGYYDAFCNYWFFYDYM